MFSLFASYLVPHYMLFHADIHSHLRPLVLISIYCFLSINLVFLHLLPPDENLIIVVLLIPDPAVHPLCYQY